MIAGSQVVFNYSYSTVCCVQHMSMTEFHALPRSAYITPLSAARAGGGGGINAHLINNATHSSVIGSTSCKIYKGSLVQAFHIESVFPITHHQVRELLASSCAA